MRRAVDYKNQEDLAQLTRWVQDLSAISAYIQDLYAQCRYQDNVPTSARRLISFIKARAIQADGKLTKCLQTGAVTADDMHWFEKIIDKCNNAYDVTRQLIERAELKAASEVTEAKDQEQQEHHHQQQQHQQQHQQQQQQDQQQAAVKGASAADSQSIAALQGVSLYVDPVAFQHYTALQTKLKRVEEATQVLSSTSTKKGEEQVSSRHDSAFAIAMVTTALWREVPEMGDLLLAHFYARCPYLVPYYIPRLQGQSDREYFESRGYKYTKEGVVETQAKFLTRMSGLMRLYFAILVSCPPRGSHPHGPEQAGVWINRVLGLEPEPDITSTMMYDFLQVTGQVLHKEHNREFMGLLCWIKDHLLPKSHKDR